MKRRKSSFVFGFILSDSGMFLLTPEFTTFRTVGTPWRSEEGIIVEKEPSVLKEYTARSKTPQSRLTGNQLIDLGLGLSFKVLGTIFLFFGETLFSKVGEKKFVALLAGYRC
jgi:hypothetical protein